jgi:hypothetical protein
MPSSPTRGMFDRRIHSSFTTRPGAETGCAPNPGAGSTWSAAGCGAGAEHEGSGGCRSPVGPRARGGRTAASDRARFPTRTARPPGTRLRAALDSRRSPPRRVPAGSAGPGAPSRRGKHISGLGARSGWSEGRGVRECGVAQSGRGGKPWAYRKIPRRPPPPHPERPVRRSLVQNGSSPMDRAIRRGRHRALWRGTTAPVLVVQPGRGEAQIGNRFGDRINSICPFGAG